VLERIADTPISKLLELLPGVGKRGAVIMYDPSPAAIA
jgi:hypothetical protein